MNFNDKLVLLRKEHQLSQEALAEMMNISRQAVAKWETGSSLPDLTNLLLLSEIFGVSLDRLVKSDEESCITKLIPEKQIDESELVEFLYEAKRNTYAAGAPDEKVSCRPMSHDLKYEKGKYLYIDTYLGSVVFSGQEAVWENGVPIFTMNYHGRVTDEEFDGKVLKAALIMGCDKQLQRGPQIFKYNNSVYHCYYSGSREWFHGCEEIYVGSKKVYECVFHGGKVID